MSVPDASHGTGWVRALQFAPQALLPLTGYAVDRFDRRCFLIITQSAVSARSFAFGLLTVTGIVRLWEVEVLAFLIGSVTAFDGRRDRRSCRTWSTIPPSPRCGGE